MFRFTRSRPVLGAVALAVAAGCGEAVTSAPTTPKLALSMSRVAVPTTGKHVFLLKGSVPGDFANRVEAAGGSVLSSMPGIGVVTTDGLSDADAQTIAGTDDVARDYEGRWVPTPDELQLSAMSLSTQVDVTSAQPPQNAFLLPLQWNMFQIHAPEAWATHTGIPSVRVAILDSGLDPFHIEQRGLIDVAASTAFVPSTLGPPAWLDDFFHGTFVGGIVTSNNINTAGVAPNVTLVAVKVLGSNGSGPIGAVIAGIYYATDVAKVNVINMSLGLAFPKNVPGASTLLSAMNRAINHAHSQGVLVVTASGNEFADLQHDRNFIELPCEAGVQMCVSATGIGDTHASYSNYGVSAIDVAAPGGDGPPPAPGHVGGWILGPCSSRVCGTTRGYLLATGTSASAPHVAGLAAFLDSQYGGLLSASRMRALIEQNADDIGKPGTDPFFGKGRINVFNSVNTVHP